MSIIIDLQRRPLVTANNVFSVRSIIIDGEEFPEIALKRLFYSYGCILHPRISEWRNTTRTTL